MPGARRLSPHFAPSGASCAAVVVKPHPTRFLNFFLQKAVRIMCWLIVEVKGVGYHVDLTPSRRLEVLVGLVAVDEEIADQRSGDQGSPRICAASSVNWPRIRRRLDASRGAVVLCASGY